MGYATASPNDAPNFQEVYQLLASNLVSASAADLNGAAVRGLLDHLSGQAKLVEHARPTSMPADAIAKITVFDNSYAYFRISQVEGNLAESFRSAYENLLQTNKTKIKGIILDLRFAGGDDYAAAAATADCFIDSDQPLLDWGANSAHATTKTNNITAPVAILVNSETSGAAEALAAALREAKVGLILGTPTASHAYIFKDFKLSNGDTLRIATANVKLGNGDPLSQSLKPDVAVDTTLADEREYQIDPYKILHPVASTETNSDNLIPPNHRPTNEAELVREHATGGSLEDDVTPQNPSTAQPVPPVVADATLARALDLLKGLAVIQLSHPG